MTHDLSVDRQPLSPEQLDQLRTDAFQALLRDDIRKLAAILKQVGNPHALDYPSGTPRDTLLERAIRVRSLPLARLLIERGAEPMRSSLVENLRSPHILGLSSASMKEQTVREFTDLLSGAGADFDHKDDQGWTALHYAINCGSLHMAKILIDRGAWIDPKLLTESDRDGQVIADWESEDHQRSMETMRLVRSRAMEQSLLSAMSGGDAPAAASSSNGMTL